MIAVSVCIITYNQEKYIAQAIESALSQQVNFENEIIICDDCSTDNTRTIIQSYAHKHPKKISAHFVPQNIGMLKNWEHALKLCKGKYIALLEGDDFWNDNQKLQKQFDILEKNLDCSVSFTNANIKYEAQQKPDEPYVNLLAETYTTGDLLQYNFVPTCSVLMRNNITDSFFHSAYFKSPFADWIIHILNSQFGKLHFLNELTCTYRVHSTGVWGGMNEEKQLINKLLALDSIGAILSETNLNKQVNESRRETLQKICALHKQQKKYFNYLKCSVKLLLIK